MQRRTLLQFLLTPILGRAQTTFPGTREPALKALAAVVLPSSIDTALIVEKFIKWTREYRPGADLEHGYGFPRFRSTPTLPIANYLRQLDELGPTPTRDAVEHAIAAIPTIPPSPNGTHIATDLMSFYFRSSDANDECYRARIGRDQCRSLAGSDRAPAPR